MIKPILALVVVAQFALSQSHACSCGESKANPLSVIEQVVRNEFSTFDHFAMDATREIVMIKAFPSVYEKLNLTGFKNTSCEIKGPEGESLDYCSSSRKADFEVKIAAKGCSMVVRARYTTHSVSAKVIKSNCN